VSKANDAVEAKFGISEADLESLVSELGVESKDDLPVLVRASSSQASSIEVISEEEEGFYSSRSMAS